MLLQKANKVRSQVTAGFCTPYNPLQDKSREELDNLWLSCGDIPERWRTKNASVHLGNRVP